MPNLVSFLSHVKKDENNKIIEKKRLIVHINGLLDNTEKSIQKTNFSNLDCIEQFIEIIIKLHDLGKYSTFFQEYLISGVKHKHNLHHHSLIGAVTAKSIFEDVCKDKAVISYFIIKHHHNDLQDFQKSFYESGDGEYNRINNQLYNQHKDLLTKLNIITHELKIDIKSSDLINYFPDLQDDLLDFSDQSDIQNYFLINYLYSLLIEADKLDASDTKFYHKALISTHLVDKYRPLIFSQLSENQDISTFSQNELRTYGRLRVNQYLERHDWQEHKLFTLTAPTGLGKTLMALDFGLKLREKIRQTDQREAQIIYALPFINIIEQSLQVYNEVFEGENINLLAHYQYADALEQTSKDETSNYNQKMMTLDTWQCDIVITTFVQFLQTLIGNRNKLLKKFNHFAGSIIILDEVQTIRLGQLPLIGASLFYLAKFLNTRIVLMTATKPKIYELANQEILKNEGEKAKSIELLPDYREIFQCFKRTKIVSLISQKIEDENDFLEQIFTQKWSDEKSCIVVCNTVKRSLDVYNLIFELVDETINPVYYLSTNIIPARRQRIIDDIKSDLGIGLKPILVSTQCVEAGVDLDFDMGFRDLSPMDSIIQVAGRINRNNDPNKKYSPLYIIDFGDCKKIYDVVTQQQARLLLEKNIEILEDNYLEVIEEYFSNVAGDKSFIDSRKIFDAMKILKYDSQDPKTDIAVSSFKVIDEKFPALSVFIEIDETAVKYKNLFIQMITKQISQEDFSPYKKDFHQHIITVPSHLPKAKDLLQSDRYLICEGIYNIPNNELEDFYHLVTGFIRTNEIKEHSRFF
jgi:CRISPR-associated endonuclease/helicase Cas3